MIKRERTNRNEIIKTKTKTNWNIYDIMRWEVIYKFAQLTNSVRKDKNEKGMVSLIM